MLSEGVLRAERICRELARQSKNSGVAEEELEDVAYVLLGAWILQSESRTHAYLQSLQASELDELISDILNNGDPYKTEDQLDHLRQLLAHAMGCAWTGVTRGVGVMAIAIRRIAGMLMHELLELDQDERKHVLDVIFYRLFTRLIPTKQKHNELVARYAEPLVRLFGGVAEGQPGTGEIFTRTGMAERADIHFDHRKNDLPQKLNDRLRFLRNLRLAARDIPFEGKAASERIFNLWLFDKSLDINRAAYDDTPMMFLNESKLQGLVDARRSGHPPMLVVIATKDRRPFKKNEHLRRELVVHHELRAVIDFTSFTAKGEGRFSLWYFGPPFLDYPYHVAQIDVRQLRLNPETDEVLSSASLVGSFLRAWTEGLPISQAILEESGAPRRVITFIEEALDKDKAQIPGFLRFVNRDQMQEKGFSLRAEDYVAQYQDKAWRAEVKIDQILARIRPDARGQSVYLIGDNGSGKSLALRDVATALALQGRFSFGVSFGTTDRFERSARSEPLKSHFTYAGARNFHNGPNMRRLLGELGDMVKEIFDDPIRLSCFETAMDRLGFQRKQYLVPLAMKSTSDHLERILADIHPLSQLSSTVSSNLKKGAYKIAVIRNNSPEIVVFDTLSSGEQQILTMVIKIVANVQRDTTVLLDEPEISLHVAWQRQLPHVLREFSKVLGCSFVVATHSPIVIASASNVYDHCFVMKKGRLKELKASERKSVEASLFEGFQTYTPYTHHIQERCAEIISRVVGDSDEQGQIWADENQFLAELESLKESLDETIVHGAASDRSLVDKAIAAVREIMTP
ncbi:AAA family ATPase [Pseudomonas sp. NPDC087346]|uniref:AAA family ATPase n=1 Tax=Pseudomonas sp. NPDC087346 TaxID=3364438 RepID=UPI00380F9BFF